MNEHSNIPLRINIAGTMVGDGCEPFIIAEMSGNHNHSLERALSIVEAAAKAGAHAIKLQTYTADTMTLDSDNDEFLIQDSENLWKGQSLYQLYAEAATPWEWHKPIFDRANELGLIAFSTPFDETAVDFLESLNAPCYKIASFENTDVNLLRRVAQTNKPIIMSTGMATVAELDEAVRVIRDTGNNNIVLLKCTSTYPASPKASNIATIPHMRKLFNCVVGLSDHTMGVGVSVGAVALGASVIEKHMTLARADGGVDSTFSMEPDEMAALVVEAKRAYEAIGDVHYGPSSEHENNSRKYRRSLYIARDLEKGDIVDETAIRAIRPGFGLPVKYYSLIIGKRVRKAIKKATPVSFDLFFED